MEIIYYKNGIYIGKETEDSYEECENNADCIFTSDSGSKHLFGGRIVLKKHRFGFSIYTIAYSLCIDGIKIYSIDSDNSFEITEYHGTEIIVSYLNAIEVNGVDAFLDNYKKSIEFFYSELKELNQQTENLLNPTTNNSNINELLVEIKKIRKLLFTLMIILFSLSVHMNAGLDNERVISLYESIPE